MALLENLLIYIRVNTSFWKTLTSKVHGHMNIWTERKASLRARGPISARRGRGGSAILSGNILALYLKIDMCIILFVFPVHKNRILCEAKLIQWICAIKNNFLFILKEVINIPGV